MNRRLKRIGVLLIAVAAIGIGIVAATGVAFGAMSSGVLPAESNDREWISEPGIVITGLRRDGPAAKAGVVRGDILLEVDDQATNTCRELRERLDGRQAGDQVKLTVRHGDETRELTATLGGEGDRVDLGIMPCHRVLAPVRADLHDILNGAARVVEVEPGSPAEQAGLAVGDTITAVDGQSLGDQSLAAIVESHQPGDTVTLEVRKPGEEPRQVSVQLGEHPDRPGKAYLGVRYALVPRIRAVEGLRPFDRLRPFDELVPLIPGEGTVQGIVVREVATGSPAEAAGLQRRDVITAIDGTPVANQSDLSEAVKARKPGDTINLTIVRPGEAEREVEVTLGENPAEPGTAFLGVRTAGFLRIERSGSGTGILERLLPGGAFEFDFDDLPFDPGELVPDVPLPFELPEVDSANL